MQIKHLRITSAITALFTVVVFSLPMHVAAQEIDSSIAPMPENPPPDKLKITLFIGAGAFSQYELFEGWHGGFPFGVSDYKMQQYSGTFSGGFKFFFNRVAFSIAFAKEHESGIWQATNRQANRDDWETEPIGTFSRETFTIAPEITFIYREESIGVGLTHRYYGSVGFGVTYEKETDVVTQASSSSLSYASPSIPQNITAYDGMSIKNDRTHYTMQVTPFGYEIGGKLKWYLELGFGYKGIVNTGLTWKVR